MTCSRARSARPQWRLARAAPRPPRATWCARGPPPCCRSHADCDPRHPAVSLSTRPRPVRATWSPQRSQSGTPGARRPQVYVHVAVREGERTLATTRADEGGPGVPRALVLGKGRRAPRAWELALLGARPPARGRAHSSALRERQATHVDSAGNPQHPLRRTRMHQVAWHNYAGACRAGCINACL